MTLNLEGACDKLDRALRHLNELGSLMEAMGWNAVENLSLAEEEVEAHPRGYRHVFRPGSLILPAAHTGLVVGDYVQNLRAALDHLAWELVPGSTRRRLTRRDREQVQFPIYEVGRSRRRGRGFWASVNRRLPDVDPTQLRVIDRFQPYHRGEWHLAALRELSNRDKHRTITPVHLRVGEPPFTSRHLSVTVGHVVSWRFLIPEGGRVAERTPFLEVVCDSPEAEVVMHSTLHTRVVFPDRPGRYQEVGGLREIGARVGEIMGTFAFRWGRRPEALRCASFVVEARAGRVPGGTTSP